MNTKSSEMPDDARNTSASSDTALFIRNDATGTVFSVLKRGNKTEGVTRLLIVDDEKRILQTFLLMFSDSGYYVKTAVNAEEALLHIAGERFDVVFLDCYIGKTAASN